MPAADIELEPETFRDNGIPTTPAMMEKIEAFRGLPLESTFPHPRVAGREVLPGALR